MAHQPVTTGDVSRHGFAVQPRLQRRSAGLSRGNLGGAPADEGADRRLSTAHSAVSLLLGCLVKCLAREKTSLLRLIAVG